MSVEDSYQAFMLDYVAGTLPAGLQFAAELHRLLSSEGGEAAAVWQAAMEQLSLSDSNNSTGAHQSSTDMDAIDVVLNEMPDIKWRRGLSGATYSEASIGGGRLMRLEPGQSVMTHGHSTLEATVVLSGSLGDGKGEFEMGDILLARPGYRHKPEALGNSRCLCFVAKGKTPFWRLT